MSDIRTYRHSITGQVAQLREDEAAVFPHVLELVPDGTKPLLPGMFKPGLLGEAELPDPVTEEQEAAEANLAEVLEDHAPNSKAAREARAEVKAAEEAAAAAVADTEKEK